MFQSARFKLTAWYLLIIMAVSLAFSLVIFRLLDSELDQNYRRMVLRYEQLREILPPDVQPPAIGPETLQQSEDRVKLNLLYINLAILVISTTAGYFLAGRTLNPIKEMIEEQNRFITDASHELRTPLTSLKTSIEVFLRDKQATPKDAKALIKSNLEEVNSLQILSDNLLAVAKPGNSGQPLNTESLSLTEAGREALEKITSLAKDKEVNVRPEFREVNIQGTKQEIVRLMVIFLDNAVKYSNQGSRVLFTIEPEGNYGRIVVQDQGIGIAEGDLPHIFDRFYRADKSRSQTDGHGLGLSIAKKIIQEHHGVVTVESKLSKGTTFTVLLPVKQPRPIL